MRLRARVAASSANLGSGFDCLGLALDWTDEVTIVAGADQPNRVIEVHGPGADDLPRDESHLVARSLTIGLAEFGGPATGYRLTCRNSIPHARGLGSSAAAIVAGLALAWGLARPSEPLDRRALLRLGDAIEGHPDNVGAAVHGGAVLSWRDEDGVEALALQPHPDLRLLVFVPESQATTSRARAALPESVPHRDAVAQASRSALLTMALTRRPDLMLSATGDLLHQPYRARMMPMAHDLMSRLRAAGAPAAVSGAGPSVIAIGTAAALAASGAVGHEGFVAHRLGIGSGVALESLGPTSGSC